jgi:hypothetical protein
MQAINAKGPLPGMLAAGLSKTDLDQITFSGHVIVTRLPVHQQIVVSGQQTAMRDECIVANVKWNRILVKPILIDDRICATSGDGGRSAILHRRQFNSKDITECP